MHVRNFQLVVLTVGMAAIGGCAVTPSGPPKGWVSIDPVKSEGVYIANNGSRWIGGYQNGKLEGKGTFLVGTKHNTQGYSSGSIPPGFESVSFIRMAKDDNWIAGPITIIAPDNLERRGFIFKGMTDGVGLKGPGRLVRGDGFTLEGDFDYGNMPIAWPDSNGYVQWENYRLIASYAHGVVTASWVDGSTFEGEVLDFYLFDRSSFDITCKPSYFYGNGLLKRPGKKDYIGLVTEFGGVQPVSKEDFLSYVELFGDCPSEALAKQSEINNRQAAYDTEMAEGRKRAGAILTADLSMLSNKIANNMARVESASRGSSVEMDRENERKNAVLHEILIKSQTKNKSTAHLRGEKKSESNFKKSVAEESPQSTTALSTNERKSYPFSRTITYESTYANLSKEKAQETVNAERVKLEPNFLASAINWQVVSASPPDCAVRQDIRESGHWVCKITVKYKGESYSKQDDGQSANSSVQSR